MDHRLPQGGVVEFDDDSYGGPAHSVRSLEKLGENTTAAASVKLIHRRKMRAEAAARAQAEAEIAEAAARAMAMAEAAGN